MRSTNKLGLIAAAALLAIGDFPGAVAADFGRLPVDYPEGTGAMVRLVSRERAANVNAPTISTFLIDYEPGGSAVLQRSPRQGYVLVHVLSGSIRAEAWRAGVGSYRAGQTWTQPALANDIESRNASPTEPARALVILVTGAEQP